MRNRERGHRPSIHDEQRRVVRNLHGDFETGAVVSPLNFRFAANDVKYAADVTNCKVLIVDEALSSKIEPIAKGLDYVKQFICVGAEVPPFMKLYSEIAEKGDPSDVLADTGDDDMAS